MQSGFQMLEQQLQQRLLEWEQEQHKHQEDKQRVCQEMQLCECEKGESSSARTSVIISRHAKVGVTFARACIRC